MSNLVNTDSKNGTPLFAGGFPQAIIAVIILLGSGVLAAGTVLGKIIKGAASAAAKTGGNTGDGTLTLDATTPILGYAIPGIYIVRCIAAATNGGTFRVTDPKGKVLGDVAVGATFANQIKFLIADGETDFAVGDGFDVTIAAGSGKYKPYDKDNVDGSEVAAIILAEDIDATSADVKTTAYAAGHFNEAALTGIDDNAKACFEGTPIFIGQAY